MKKIILAIMLLAVVGILSLPFSEKTFADCGDVETSILSCGDSTDAMGGINYILNLILSILVYGIGAVGVLGVIIAGIMYMTARDSTEQVAKAKKRLAEISVGMVAFALMGSLLSWLVPGGIKLNFGSSSDVTTDSAPTEADDAENAGNEDSNEPLNSTEEKATDRKTGSEEASDKNISVGSGNEGWLEN